MKIMDHINWSGKDYKIQRQLQPIGTGRQVQRTVEERKIMNEDRMVLQSDYRLAAENDFIRKSANLVTDDLRQQDEGRAEQIAVIKQQIADGTYRVDAAAIADEILKRGWMNAETEESDS